MFNPLPRAKTPAQLNQLLDAGYMDQYAIHYFVKENKIEMVDLMIKRGTDPNKSDKSGTPPLVYASSNHDMCQFLLDCGADPNSVNKYGETVLHLTEDPNIIQLMLANGADPNMEARLPHQRSWSSYFKVIPTFLVPLFGQFFTPWWIYHLKYTRDFSYQPIHRPKSLVALKLLLDGGADVNAVMRLHNINPQQFGHGMTDGEVSEYRPINQVTSLEHFKLLLEYNVNIWGYRSYPGYPPSYERTVWKDEASYLLWMYGHQDLDVARKLINFYRADPFWKHEGTCFLDHLISTSVLKDYLDIIDRPAKTYLLSKLPATNIEQLHLNLLEDGAEPFWHEKKTRCYFERLSVEHQTNLIGIVSDERLVPYINNHLDKFQGEHEEDIQGLVDRYLGSRFNPKELNQLLWKVSSLNQDRSNHDNCLIMQLLRAGANPNYVENNRTSYSFFQSDMALRVIDQGYDLDLKTRSIEHRTPYFQIKKMIKWRWFVWELVRARKLILENRAEVVDPVMGLIVRLPRVPFREVIEFV